MQTATQIQPSRGIGPGKTAHRFRHVLCFALAAVLPSPAESIGHPTRTLAQGGLISVASAAEAPRQALPAHRDPLRRNTPPVQRMLAGARFLAADGGRAEALALYAEAMRRDRGAVATWTREHVGDLSDILPLDPGPARPRSPAPRATELGATFRTDRSRETHVDRQALHLVDGRIGLEGLRLGLHRDRLRQGPTVLERYGFGGGITRPWNSFGRASAEISVTQVDDHGEGERAHGQRGDHTLWGLGLGAVIEAPQNIQLSALVTRRPLDAPLAARERIHLLASELEVRWRPRDAHSIGIAWGQGLFADGNRRRTVSLRTGHPGVKGLRLRTDAAWTSHDRTRTIYWSDASHWSASAAALTPTRSAGLAPDAMLEFGAAQTGGDTHPFARVRLGLRWTVSTGTRLGLGWERDGRTWADDRGAVRSAWWAGSSWGF